MHECANMVPNRDKGVIIAGSDRLPAGPLAGTYGTRSPQQNHTSKQFQQHCPCYKMLLTAEVRIESFNLVCNANRYEFVFFQYSFIEKEGTYYNQASEAIRVQ